MFNLDSQRFFRLAERVVFYKGVMRGRIEIEQQEKSNKRVGSSGSSTPQTTVPGTRGAMEFSPETAGLVDWGN